MRHDCCPIPSLSRMILRTSIKAHGLLTTRTIPRFHSVMSHAELIGQSAPSFSLPDQDGKTYDFKPEQGMKPTALLFYPASGMPCTQVSSSTAEKGLQARMAVLSRPAASRRPWRVRTILFPSTASVAHVNWSSENIAFSAEKVQVIGISPDSVSKQKQFVEDNKLSVRPSYMPTGIRQDSDNAAL